MFVEPTDPAQSRGRRAGARRRPRRWGEGRGSTESQHCDLVALAILCHIVMVSKYVTLQATALSWHVWCVCLCVV